jgi:hypothetical protein
VSHGTGVPESPGAPVKHDEEEEDEVKEEDEDSDEEATLLMRK